MNLRMANIDDLQQLLDIRNEVSNIYYNISLFTLTWIQM